MEKYKINEIFESIQGEGSNQGIHSIFIRFYGCDYACSWCDSKGASIWETKLYKEYTLEELLGLVRSYKAKNIVLTGGNPVISMDKEMVLAFKNLGYTIEVETQGSKFHDALALVDLITISPKNIFKNSSKATKDNINFIAKLQVLGYNKPIALKYIYNNDDDFIIENFKAVQVQLSNSNSFLNFFINPLDNGNFYNNQRAIKEFYNSFIKLSVKLGGLKPRLGLQLHKIIGVE